MFLGIEIGGTKLQLGVGTGEGPGLVTLRRIGVPAGADAQWIRETILPQACELARIHQVRAVGVGFGGPINPAEGRVVRSHQVAGWEDFPLAAWLAEAMKLPVGLGNDADCAGLAEAVLGAGKGRQYVFYTNVGSGIGGAIVIGGQVYTGGRGIAAEIGHLRPCWKVESQSADVEALASGWAITKHARQLVAEKGSEEPGVKPLLELCGGQPDRLTVKEIAEAARLGSQVARVVLEEACRVYGWAIAQAVTLLAPEVVVVGGGVSLIGEELFFRPLRRYINDYVFPPLRGTFEVVPAALGEEVVVHGAILLARQAAGQQAAS